MGVSRRGAPAAIVSKDKRGWGAKRQRIAAKLHKRPHRRRAALGRFNRKLVEGSTGSGPGVGQWAAQRTQAAATRTLARRRASRSRFTWLCLYEVELLGKLEGRGREAAGRVGVPK